MTIGFVNAALQMGLESILITPRVPNFQNIVVDNITYENIQAQITIEETHTDELEITDHPVQQGAAIADHAFKLPAEVVIKMGWSNSPSQSSDMVNAALGAAAANSPVVNALANVAALGSAAYSVLSGGAVANTMNDVYNQLLWLQQSRALFDVYTARRKYTNMVCKSLAVQNDYKTANSLFVTMTCKQVILVNTQTVQISQATAANPKANASVANKGSAILKQGQDVISMTNAALKSALGITQ